MRKASRSAVKVNGAQVAACTQKCVPKVTKTPTRALAVTAKPTAKPTVKPTHDILENIAHGMHGVGHL